jgi:predicted methyltransferase
LLSPLSLCWRAAATLERRRLPHGARAVAAEAASPGGLEGAVAGNWRTEAEKARDQWRHPIETLTFFGVKPSDTVVEIAPGGGWYTAILGPWLKSGGGKLYAGHVDPPRRPMRRRTSMLTRPPSSITPKRTATSRSRSARAPALAWRPMGQPMWC